MDNDPYTNMKELILAEGNLPSEKMKKVSDYHARVKIKKRSMGVLKN